MIHVVLGTDFPAPDLDSGKDLYALTDGMSAERIMAAGLQTAYSYGMTSEKSNRWRWVIPQRRSVIPIGNVYMSTTTRQMIQKLNWTITFNQCFSRVMDICAHIPRYSDDIEFYVEGDDELAPGSWLDVPTVAAYTELNLQGKSYSIEVWDGENLIGGLFGVYHNPIVTVESMFSLRNSASKAAMLALEQWAYDSDVSYIDCQEPSTHISSMGAELMPRADFLTLRNTTTGGNFMGMPHEPLSTHYLVLLKRKLNGKA